LVNISDCLKVLVQELKMSQPEPELAKLKRQFTPALRAAGPIHCDWRIYYVMAM
jgi:hypothetical protein